MLKTLFITVILSVAVQLMGLLVFSFIGHDNPTPAALRCLVVGLVGGGAFVVVSVILWVMALLSSNKDRILLIKAAIVTCAGIILNTVLALLNGLHLMGLTSY